MAKLNLRWTGNKWKSPYWWVNPSGKRGNQPLVLNFSAAENEQTALGMGLMGMLKNMIWGRKATRGTAIQRQVDDMEAIRARGETSVYMVFTASFCSHFFQGNNLKNTIDKKFGELKDNKIMRKIKRTPTLCSNFRVDLSKFTLIDFVTQDFHLKGSNYVMGPKTPIPPPKMPTPRPGTKPGDDGKTKKTGTKPGDDGEEQQEEGEGGMGGGMIFLIIALCVAAIAAPLLTYFFCCCCAKKKDSEEAAPSPKVEIQALGEEEQEDAKPGCFC